MIFFAGNNELQNLCFSIIFVPEFIQISFIGFLPLSCAFMQLC